MDFSRLVAWPMKNFDKIFDESIHVHHNPLGPIGVLDEESSSKTKRNAEKSAPQWMAPLRRMPMPSLSLRSLCTGAGLHSCRVEQLQGCTVAGLHRGRVALLQGCTGAPQDLLMKNCSAFSFFSSRSCCSPSVAHKASLQSKGFRIERDRSWTEFRQIPEQQHYNGRAHFSQREYSGHWI